MKKYLISICCVIGILFSSHHSQISAQNQFNIQLLGKPKTEIAKINFIDSISLEVPFVIQDRNGNVVSDPIDLVALKIGTDSYTGAIRDSIGSKEIKCHFCTIEKQRYDQSWPSSFSLVGHLLWSFHPVSSE